MTHRPKRKSNNPPIWLILLGLVSLGLIIMTLLHGKDIALLSPKGFIASEERRLIVLAVLLLFELAIPTLILFYYTAWKYRESNEKATYNPTIKYDKSLVFNIWAIPCAMMLLLAYVMWPAAHNLAPQKNISNGAKPITIQVIAMRWKWLFIYPEQNIATVNFVQIPTNTPVQFDLSADETPMSSFWIPHLSGQLYAMTGHVNRLNLIADTTGDFAGRSAEINGAGFAGMKFIARATTPADFNIWAQNVNQSAASLDNEEYEKLLIPSEYNPAAFYSHAGPDLYATMLKKYNGSHSHHTEHE